VVNAGVLDHPVTGEPAVGFVARGGARKLPRLLRVVYAAAVGGSESDWTELDATMASEGHTAVLVRPARVYSNPADRDFAQGSSGS
jgi:hypothetical protein